ncbi:uncharacterized protein LOC116220561 [Clupea harengus]|uniref:Uncharacterized protein LOC116220561 n=1 Tax=Clupea harengus TaxID=7950 RepID=A0A8M1KIX8_CLUHA|nr:uncharacterized protein LOC116220561 [Clupea harengus]
MKVWGHVNPPSELPVECFYTVNPSGVILPSDLSSPVSVFVLDHLQKPMVSVAHDRTDMQFVIVCEIPKQSWNVTGCQLYTGHGENFYLTAKIQRASFCHFFVAKNDLFRRLQSVGSREVSCDYTVNTEPSSSSLSPRSDPHTIQGQFAQNIINLLLNTYYRHDSLCLSDVCFNTFCSVVLGSFVKQKSKNVKIVNQRLSCIYCELKVFLVTGYQPRTKNTPLTSSEAGLRSQSTSVNLKAATRGDAHTATVSPGSTLHFTSETTMDASVSPGSTLYLTSKTTIDASEYTVDASGK